MNVDNRRGELGELKSQLRQLAGSRAPGAEDLKRELFKKVTSYMTVGIDVSALFSEMIMCASNADIVLKKMCYLYLGNYAATNPELALLTINFLQKDCQDENPMIRGLALRSLCSLRVPNLVEYFTGPIKQGLKDANPYVRSVAAMGVLKLHHISPASVKDNEFQKTLKVLVIQDPDAQILYMGRVRSRDRTLGTASATAKRMKEFSEWAQCLVLELVSKYVPAHANETFDIMNVLEDRLVHANSAVVLATCKVFLHLTMSMADVHQQVYERIKSPLVTLITTGTSELAYAVLSHLHMLILRSPTLFVSDYKFFYCRYSDPSYVKKLKLEILTAIANESNTYEIVTELSEYATNVDVPIARESIRAVGRIALRRYDINGIVDRLLQFLEMDTDYVTAETLVRLEMLTACIKLFFKRPPQCQSMLGAALKAGIHDSHQDVHDRALLYYRLLQEGVGLAEKVINPKKQAVADFAESQSSEIKDRIFDEFNTLAVVYQKPSYMFLNKELVGNTESESLMGERELSSPSAHDGFLHQSEFSDNDMLLSASEKEDTRLISTGNGADAYSAPEISILDVAPAVSSSLLLEAPATVASQPKPAGTHQREMPLLPEFETPVPSSRQATPPLASQAVPMDDLFSGLSVPDTAAAAPAPPPQQLVLAPRPSLDAKAFQQKWGQLSVALTVEEKLAPTGIMKLATPQPLNVHMIDRHIFCMASGGKPPNFKYFFYAQSQPNFLDPSAQAGFFLVELHVDTARAMASGKIKADDVSLAPAFAELFRVALARFGLL
ncbi:hypothetical protein CBR_g48222 [Chara braunii]|uniref:Beta-adaptin appendage C-terminal subdomain domain-containing protein n=1 Tax=Chara braunii TaxID=69332 RepID=A0A388M2K1_CHABU|nr:hypothetical protein CBR_g48222 [Chara braunii]|eukprot:GBG88693.1 hypothetical protein CBR_g48222 [Chara braunii]